MMALIGPGTPLFVRAGFELVRYPDRLEVWCPEGELVCESHDTGATSEEWMRHIVRRLADAMLPLTVEQKAETPRDSGTSDRTQTHLESLVDRLGDELGALRVLVEAELGRRQRERDQFEAEQAPWDTRRTHRAAPRPSVDKPGLVVEFPRMPGGEPS